MDKYNKVYNQIKHNWDLIAKPLDSMGRFEELTAKIGAIQGNLSPCLDSLALIVLCSDNGIVEEGVSQSGQEVTAICAGNIAAGKSAAGVMASLLGVDLITVDVGIACKDEIPNVINKKIRAGTRNFIKEAAMSPDECERAIQTGIELAGECSKKYDAVCIGEMGIGNTTTSAAVAAGLLRLGADEVCGRGAGLSDQGLARKRQVVDTAIKKYDLVDRSAREILEFVGGFDLAAMAGLCLGAKKYGLPVILDGAISLTAALLSEKLDSGCRNYLIPSHKSREPLTTKICGELGKDFDPVIDASMALGEGSGAVMMAGLLRTTLEVYNKALKFEASGVAQYERKLK
ncbi:nicotinate-nucleotide--dimethylbenzimidazole phosphoribosyltransferase [Treponema sp. JC4]|uniref:nicotinate-nucleotide--dimethylbenzimidazole phosphoribosyltransferase n=1 Tax=Treponema sp. JC4 TaxID=1124982 RepID=UPI00025B0A0F|nr:nicotinate-nucleotide--dimethylbenzimidazole phosphoribosyltransferase [Treponema sp. JC4]EID85719.1 nicotinate-nucleotide--dimethylbenzimidazole phosphoribosyltransferase [Treponema sp. JC4]